ncbi:MAG: type IVa pilus pseudopilin TppB [Thiohalomonadaceae bacterium]
MALRQNGFSLVEVLVTMLILAIGLLGLAGLQLTSLRNNTTAYERSQATLLAYSIIDRMRANRDAAGTGAYTVALDAGPSGTNCVGVGAACNPAAMAAYDVSQWKCELGKWTANAACAGILGILPEGDGAIDVNGDVVTVTIQWEEKREADSAAGKLTTLVVSTVL